MRLYFELIKNAFQTNITYRAETFMQLFRSTIILIVQIFIWNALIKDGWATFSGGSVTLQDMITYSIVSTAISILINNRIIERIEQKIKTGEIAMDLIKPLTLRANLFCESIGNVLFRLIFEIIPLLLLGHLLLGLNVRSFPVLLVFLVSLINGVFIYWLMSYICGLYAMWYFVAWHMGALLFMLNSFFSGSLVPLWFFPDFLADISYFLPFRLVFFTPISILLGKISLYDGLWAIAQQFVWIAILLVLEKIVWRSAVKKLVVQGG